jgi:hypothetical protein
MVTILIGTSRTDLIYLLRSENCNSQTDAGEPDNETCGGREKGQVKLGDELHGSADRVVRQSGLQYQTPAYT